MDSPQVVSRSSIFILPRDFWTSVQGVGPDLQTRDPPIQPPVEEKVPSIESLQERTNFLCRTCKVELEGLEQFQQHFRTDWHNFNLKLKLRGAESIGEKEFIQLLSVGELSDEDSDSDEESEEGDDNSTHSKEDKLLETLAPKESENEEEDTALPRSAPKILFTTSDGNSFFIWKRILTPGDPKEAAEYLKLVSTVSEKRNWSIFLCAGGRFAGGVFQGSSCVKHKTMHKYTVRRKQGGSQCTKDNQSATSQPKSAGANIRRQNEKKLRENIAELLKDWKPLIDSSDIVFLFAPSFNKKYFFFENSPLQSKDNRIRSIPFTTRRPTLLEVKRVHQWLSTIEFVQPTEPPPSTPIPPPTPPLQPVTTTLSSSVELSSSSEEISTTQKTQNASGTSEDLLHLAVKNRNIQEIEKLIREDYIRPVPSDPLQINSLLFTAVTMGYSDVVKCLLQHSQPKDEQLPSKQFWTALHEAAALGNEELVELLLESGVNPTLRGIDGKSAYDVVPLQSSFTFYPLTTNKQCKNKKTTLLFRRYAGKNPDKWDWKKVGIPLLTPELEQQQLNHELQRKKQKRKGQQERLKQKKVQEKEAQEKAKIEQEQRQQALELQSVEKSRTEKLQNMKQRDVLATTAELRRAQKKCDNCGIVLTSIPFERLSFLYCTTKCVADHKLKLSSNNKS